MIRAWLRNASRHFPFCDVPKAMKSIYVDPTAVVEDPSAIGPGTRIWHFSHVMKEVLIGPDCNLGQNVFVASGVRIGRNCKIQNNVSLYSGVELEDDVFCGPSCVFTNIVNPRAQIVRRNQYERTLVRQGATIGANATIVCGATIGRYAFIGAGAVVRSDVPDYALMLGVPAGRAGWMSRHGHRLQDRDELGCYVCPESGWRYSERDGELVCVEPGENQPLTSLRADSSSRVGGSAVLSQAITSQPPDHPGHAHIPSEVAAPRGQE